MHDVWKIFTYKRRGLNGEALAVLGNDGDGRIAVSRAIGRHIPPLQLGLLLRLTRMPNLDF